MEEWPPLAAPTSPVAGNETAAAPPHPPASNVGAWGAAAAQRRPARETPEQAVNRLVGSCRSVEGIAVAVVDANAAISGGSALAASASKLVTVPEVLEEVRDAAARRRLALLPAPVETIEPSPEFVKKVVKFARDTGDLQTLSDVDIKIIALAYMLEAQIHGTSHLRERPPPLHVVNVKNLPEAQMPGWGSNVPNLAEWEALEQIADGGVDQESRILPLKDLNNHVIPMSDAGNTHEAKDDEHKSFPKPGNNVALEKEIATEVEQAMPHIIDSSQGEDPENGDGWCPAVSRSRHRRYLRRKARRGALQASDINVEGRTDIALNDGDNTLSEGTRDSIDVVECKDYQEEHDANPMDDFYTVQDPTKSNNDGFAHIEEENGLEIPRNYVESDHQANGESEVGNGDTFGDGNNVNACIGELDNLEIRSETEESVNASCTDDRSSEQSWALRSLSESTVACVTSDYAMQNVILQIGLRLLAPGGMQIRQLHRWVLRCHACFKVTQEIGRIFCPKCGNGGTLRKVSVTVGENGIVMAARRPRVILRGTKFSLPMPQGGREAMSKNPILREDQLPRKVLHPASKKPSKQEDNFLGADDIFSHTGEKRAPLKPPVRKALAMFSGKRNPNDNHFSRRKH